MTKVGSAKFKARLGHYLRAVRAGQEIIITDRDHPVARVVPIEAESTANEKLVIHQPNPNAPRFCDLKFKKTKYDGPDPVEWLLEDRRRR